MAIKVHDLLELFPCKCLYVLENENFAQVAKWLFCYTIIAYAQYYIAKVIRNHLK